MTLDQVLVLSCSALWLLHVVQLVRAPLRRSWPALAIALSALGATLLSYLLLERAAVAAAAIVVLFLLAPALATQAASRALKWGRIGWARSLALGAFVLRPIPAQRVFRSAMEVAWRIDRGEAVDIVAAVEQLGAMSPVERAVNTAAFLSWTNDFQGIARALAVPGARRFALRSGMSAIVVTAAGESGEPEALLELHRELATTGALGRRHADVASAQLALAAYLGDAKVVHEHAPVYALDAPPERMAFVIATAEQRAGDPERAQRTIEAAMAKPMRPSARARLAYRLEHPLGRAPQGEAYDRARADLIHRLEMMRTLAPLRIGMRRPAPVTLIVALSLLAAFMWQVGHGSFEDAFDRFAVVAPFAQAPQAYRLITYAWMHLDGWHIAVNLIGLLVFGRFVEHHFGVLRYAAIYLAGVIGGAAAFLVWQRTFQGAIGASGAVMALFGATVARVALDRSVRRSVQGRRELLFLVSIAALQLVIDALVVQSSGSAHAGGLAAGVLLGALLRRRAA